MTSILYLTPELRQVSENKPRQLSHSHFFPSKADLYLATKIATYLEPEVRLRPGRTDLLPGVDLLRIGPHKLDRFIYKANKLNVTKTAGFIVGRLDRLGKAFLFRSFRHLSFVDKPVIAECESFSPSPSSDVDRWPLYRTFAEARRLNLSFS